MGRRNRASAWRRSRETDPLPPRACYSRGPFPAFPSGGATRPRSSLPRRQDSGRPVAAEHRAAAARWHQSTIPATPPSRARRAAWRRRRSDREVRAVFRIGIDKSKVSRETATSSAARLAKLVKINSKAYAAEVAAAGSSAFVPAIVLRMDAPDVPLGSEIRAIPGALSIKTGQMLALTRDFARPVIGTVAEAKRSTLTSLAGPWSLGIRRGHPDCKSATTQRCAEPPVSRCGWQPPNRVAVLPARLRLPHRPRNRSRSRSSRCSQLPASP